MSSVSLSSPVEKSFISDPIVSNVDNDLLTRIQHLKSKKNYKSDSVLVNRLATIKATDLSTFLKESVEELLKEDNFSIWTRTLDRLAAVLPTEQLKELTKVEDVLAEAQSQFEEAKIYLDKHDCQDSPTFKCYISSILNHLILVLESLITIFGIGDFFRPVHNQEEAFDKSQIIMILFHLFGIISAVILPLLNPTTGSFIVSGVFLGFVALSILWPCIKPMTSHLPADAENWSQQAQVDHNVAYGRKESLDNIANILKMNRHALLIGPSRVGKSLTAKAFALAIEQDKYPELKGKKVFRINTKNLSNPTSGFRRTDVLKEISKAMGRHRKDIILVLDEIHVACEGTEKIAERLKTFLEEKGEFPHVIGITTDEEYKTHVRVNTAFDLRFDQVRIQNTNEEETLKILSDTLLTSRSAPLIEEDSLHYLYQESQKIKGVTQPNTSLKILKRCINRTEKTQLSQTEKKIIEISDQILSLRSQAAASHGRKRTSYSIIQKLEQELAQMQQVFQEENEKIKSIFKAKNFLNFVTKEMYQSIVKITSVYQNKNSEKQIKQLLLLKFLDNYLFEHIQSKMQTSSITPIIDKKMIKEEITRETQ